MAKGWKVEMLWLAVLLVLLANSRAQGCPKLDGRCTEWWNDGFVLDPIKCKMLDCQEEKLLLNVLNLRFRVDSFFENSVIVLPRETNDGPCQATVCHCGSCQFSVFGEISGPSFICSNNLGSTFEFRSKSYVIVNHNCTRDQFESAQCAVGAVVNTSEAESPASSPKTGAIVGGAVGGGVGAALLLGCVYCAVAARRRVVKQRALALAGPSKFPPFDSHFISKSGRVIHYNSNNSGSDATSNSYGSSLNAVLVDGAGSGRDGSSSTRFSYMELQEATNGFSEDGRLGDGGFGTVYKGKLRDGRVVAVKKLNPWNAQGKYQFDNEVNILSRVTHPHLVRLYGCCIEQELLLVYEFVANGTLADHLHENPRDFLGWDARLTVAIQCAEALAFLHTSVCYHRDVKSTNILLDERFHCKVGDFGLSRLVPSLELTHITTAPQGTPGYLDPDYHQSYQLTDKSDVYSLGVVLMELISSQRAVDMSRDRKEINLAALAVSRIQCGELDKLVDPKLGSGGDPVRQRMVESVAELGFECLAAEKDDRPCMKEVAARLRTIEEEGKQRYLEQMVAIRGGAAASAERKNEVQSSPTSVQMVWPSNSTSPNDSSASL